MVKYVFYDNFPLKSITLPNSVESIGYYAFNRSILLTSIKFQENVALIGRGAFERCNELESSTVSPGKSHYKSVDGVTSISNSAFNECSSLTSIELAGGITSNGDSVFSGCNLLASITLPNGITSIGDYAFFGCRSLTSITFQENVASIGFGVFANCDELESITDSPGNSHYKSVDDVLFNKDGCELIFYRSKKKETTYTIPDGVKELYNYAFYECNSLISITLPNGIKSIGNSAFFECRSLTSITFQENVASIGYRTFEKCDKLESITVSSGNPHYKSVDGALFNKDGSELIFYPLGKKKPRSSMNINSSVIKYIVTFCLILIIIVIIHKRRKMDLLIY